MQKLSTRIKCGPVSYEAVFLLSWRTVITASLYSFVDTGNKVVLENEDFIAMAGCRDFHFRGKVTLDSCRLCTGDPEGGRWAGGGNA